MKKSIGLALSGGGARGLTHVGVLRALDELGIKPTHISGTSAGALVGGMYACGIPPMQILEIVEKQKFLTPAAFNVRGKGFFSLKPLIQMLEKNLSIRKFEDLPIRFFVTAVDLEDGVACVFSEGDMLMPMVASSAVPLMFPPVIMDEKHWVDGGVINNFPVEPVADCTVVIGSNVSTWPETHKHWTRFQIAQRCFHLTMNHYLPTQKEKCHIFIDPPVGHYASFGKSKLRELVETGYQYTMAHQDKLLQLTFAG